MLINLLLCGLPMDEHQYGKSVKVAGQEEPCVVERTPRRRNG